MINDNEIKLDPHNYRIHGDENKRLINKSLTECGTGRSVLMDRENVMIAGNGVYEEAQKLGLKVRIIESDGKELIVIKRTDLSTKDEKRKLLALADNHTSDTSEFDFSAIVEDFGVDTLEVWDMYISFEEKDFSNKNKELDLDLFDDKFKIILEYTSEDYLKVKEALADIAPTPDEAVYKMLFKHE